MGEKKHDFFFSLFAIMCVRACIDAFYHFYQPPPHHPGTHDADRSGSLGTNIVIYTSGKPGGANNGMNVSSPRGGKCKNVSFYPRRVESKFGRVVFFAKKKSMGTCGKSHYYGGWEKKNKNNRTKKQMRGGPTRFHTLRVPPRAFRNPAALFILRRITLLAAASAVAAATSSESLRISRTRLSPKQYNNNNNNIGCLYYVLLLLLLLFYCTSYRAGVQISLNRIWNLFIRIDRLQL